LYKTAVLTHGNAFVTTLALRIKSKFSSTFFKRWWCPEGKAFGARRSGRNLIVSAHFGKLENFLQVKKFSKTDCELAFAPNTR